MSANIPPRPTHELLRSSELFRTLLDDDLDFISRSTALVSLDDGEALFSKGDEARALYIVAEGAVSLTREDSSPGRSPGSGKCEADSRVELARFISGETLGDFDFALSGNYDASAVASGKAFVYAFPGRGKNLDDLTEEQPGTVARIRFHALAMMSARLRATHLLISENSPWIRELRKQVYSDASTGLWNRAFLDEEVPRSLAQPGAFIAIKPNKFKEMNDRHGHSAGDLVMSKIAAALSSVAAARGDAWAVRLRSNETGLAVSHCDDAEAMALALECERLFALIDIAEIDPSWPAGFAGCFAVASWPADGKNWGALVKATHSAALDAWGSGASGAFFIGDSSGASSVSGKSGGTPAGAKR